MGEGERERIVESILERLRAELARGEGAARRPASTYRLQLSREFGFAEAAAVVPYLHALGVTDVYLSPILAATPGSAHGYDVVDHNALSTELGGEEGYARLCAALAERGMGQLVDFVPNHMGIGPWNPLWVDVLENGPSSQYAPFFDIDWRPVKVELDNKVLVPVLGEQFGVVLERGELKLLRDGGAFLVTYHEHRFPIAPRAVPQILRHRLEALRDELGAQDVHVQELESIITSLEKLPPRSETDSAKVAERAREKEVAKRRLAALCDASPRIRDFIDENVALFNGRPGDPRSFDLLERLLDGQAYRLAHWRVAGEEINYRRFFDINALAAIRMEDPRVFEEAHRLVLRLVREGKVTGLRVDHPDGLYAPSAYFRTLLAAVMVERVRASPEGAALDTETAQLLLDALADAFGQKRMPRRPLYVVAEKILGAGEEMPDRWVVDGTTGYEFLNAVNGLFVEPASARAFDEVYARFTGRRETFRDVVYEKKKLIMSSPMASEMNMLAQRLNRISETNRRTRDFTLNNLTRALVEFVALFPIYRTYVRRRGDVDERDRRYIEETAARARRRSPVIDPSIYDFLRDVLLQRYPEGLSDRERRDWLEFTLKFQQVTGPVMAKAVEDTSFYVYTRLVSLNEVGGDPREFGVSPATFHERCAHRLARWPGSLNATSTHDTKRAEDVRVRIDVLSEIPAEWRARIGRWARLNRRFRSQVDGEPAPDRSDELLLYQTLVGTLADGAVPGQPGWEEYVRRIAAYMEKAAREAKVHTSWTSVNGEYEMATRQFVQGVLGSRPFVDELGPFVRRVAAAGRISSLAQVALKCAAPGVSDIYQGCEIWEDSLVDPDNRRPVDFQLRARMLDALARRTREGGEARAALAREVSAPEAMRDGRAKLLLLATVLELRRAEPTLFLDGDYRALAPEGPHAGSVVAFSRRRDGRTLLCVVPRLVLRLLDAGGGRIAWDARLRLPPDLPRAYVDVVTGERREGDALEVAALFETFPVALLASA